jgi:hypothetical protein
MLNSQDNSLKPNLSSASHSPGEGSTVGKPERRRPFGIPNRRLEDNIKMDL